MYISSKNAEFMTKVWSHFLQSALAVTCSVMELQKALFSLGGKVLELSYMTSCSIESCFLNRVKISEMQKVDYLLYLH